MPNCNTTTDCAEKVSSTCTIWDGPDIACLGITNGQTMTDVETLIANKICDLIGTVNVSDTELCDDLIARLGTKDKNIANLLQVLADYSCSLKQLINNLIGEGTTPPPEPTIVVDFKCLTTNNDPCAPPNYSLSGIFQILINNICDIQTQINTVQTTVVTNVNNTIATSIGSVLQTCLPNRIINTGTGAGAKVTIRGLMPPLTGLPYFGPLTYFDNTGKGLDSGPMCGWYICNGLNGTIDMRGLVPVGAIQGVGGGSLSPNVDPSLPANQVGTSANYSVGDTGGFIGVVLSTPQLPPHSHPITDRSHSHTNPTKREGKNGNDCSIDVFGSFNNSGPGCTNGTGNTYTTSASFTGINSTNNAGGGQGHENRMPYRAVAFITMID